VPGVKPVDRSGVFLFDTASGREVARLGKGNVRALAFSPDGRSVATADLSESEIRVYEVASRKERCVFRGSPHGNLSLAFTPDGRALAVGGQDTSVVLFDFLTANKATAPTDERMLTDLWDRLSGDDPAAAYQAQCALAAAPKPVVAFLQKQLKTAPPEPAGRVQKWLADLDSDDFAVREAATTELTKRGAAGAEALRTALKAPGLTLEKRRRIERILESIATEAVPASTIREIRSVELLERLAIDEARELLQTLARGADGSRLTVEAKSALDRLKK
jgi:hypothetical protein